MIERTDGWDLIPIYCAMQARSVDTRARRSTPQTAGHHHLLFFTMANQMISIGERMLSLEDGCIVIVPKGSDYAFSYGTQCQYYCLSFMPPKMESNPLLSEMLHRRSSILRPRDTSQRDNMLYQVKQLYTHLQKPSPLSAVPANAYRNACFIKILLDVYALQEEQQKETIGSESKSHAEQIRAYLDLHYLSPITLSDLEKAFFTSRYQLCRLFREQAQMTIFDYLRKRRIEHAAQLLVSTDLSTTGICFESGFANVQSFYTAFRRQMGKTPMKYRKEEREG